MNTNIMSLSSYELFESLFLGESLYLGQGTVSRGKNTALIRQKN